MADIFNRAGQQFNGAISADAARLIFAGIGEILGTGPAAGGVGLLAQNLQVGYTYQLSRIYEIGTNYVYLVAGRAAGQVSIARILGPRPVSLAFYSKYGDVCNAATNNINLEAAAGCSSGGTAQAQLSFKLKTVVFNSWGMTVGAESMLIQESLGGTYVSLEY